jgi:MFS family permease
VFAAVLALDSADKATIGVNATKLQQGLGIDRSQIGLLLAVSSLVGAAATIPAGALVDRVCRTRLLAWAVACWAGAMILSGVATGYLFLLLSRVALGCVTAAAAPAIASMVGDYFPRNERGRIYGYVLSGELIGAGFGFVVAGEFANRPGARRSSCWPCPARWCAGWCCGCPNPSAAAPAGCPTAPTGSTTASVTRPTRRTPTRRRPT